MLEIWLFEIVEGIGKLFLHPLLYWTVILLVLTSLKRIRRERYEFGSKLFNMFAEGKNTFVISLIFSIIVSLFSIGFGFVFSYEILVILLIVTLLLSISGSLTMLSASYTIGITFLLLMILPLIEIDFIQQLGLEITAVHFISLAILTGLFLLVEAMLVSSQKTQTFPMISLSDRGKWIGQHHLKRLAFVPFFGFLPTEHVSSIAPIFPYFQYGEQSFSLILIPFIVGFHYKIQGDLPHKIGQKLGHATLLLSIIVLAVAIGSLFYPVLAVASIVIAIIGKEWITYRHRLADRKKQAFFNPDNKGLRVLAIYPNSPAERLGIQIGEIIHKVNGITVVHPEEFYEALQRGTPYFQLDILDHRGEVRFVKSAFYQEDHHELGIIFPEKPHQEVKMDKSS